MFCIFPGGKFSEIRLTAVGRQKEVARPEKIREMINAVPVRERPQDTQKTIWRKHPRLKIVLLPTTSAIEPEINSVQPVAKAYMETGLEFS